MVKWEWVNPAHVLKFSVVVVVLDLNTTEYHFSSDSCCHVEPFDTWILFLHDFDRQACIFRNELSYNQSLVEMCGMNFENSDSKLFILRFSTAP